METSYRVEYKVDVQEGWRVGGSGNTLPEAKSKAQPYMEHGYMIRIQKVTVEEAVVFTNAKDFPVALRAAMEGKALPQGDEAEPTEEALAALGLEE